MECFDQTRVYIMLPSAVFITFFSTCAYTTEKMNACDNPALHRYFFMFTWQVDIAANLADQCYKLQTPFSGEYGHIVFA